MYLRKKTKIVSIYDIRICIGIYKSGYEDSHYLFSHSFDCRLCYIIIGICPIW